MSYSRQNTPSGHYGGDSSYGDSGRPRLLQLVVPWAAGIIVLLVTQALFTTLTWDLIAGKDLEAWYSMSPVKVVLLVYLPMVVSFTLATWAACAVHREPSSDSWPRHLVAGLVPTVGAQLVAATTLDEITLLAVLVQAGLLAVGCTLGFLVDRLRRR
ncbi:hypothetical protein [Streptomyces sp. TP-A0874]|uniref:hypothetical protein n=1 Tax=Streptomyces sp. TP-A0874 TaxID=549819 RepID=UPI000853B547|nr:hypothetical protein [Streptomyces sp. TP-A0874]